MACSFPVLVTAHSEKWCHIWNLNNIMLNNFNPLTVVESPLKYQTSSLGAFADGKGFAIGSIEGRCAIMKVNFG
jgi:mRNA export factor